MKIVSVAGGPARCSMSGQVIESGILSLPITCDSHVVCAHARAVACVCRVQSRMRARRTVKLVKCTTARMVNPIVS